MRNLSDALALVPSPKDRGLVSTKALEDTVKFTSVEDLLDTLVLPRNEKGFVNNLLELVNNYSKPSAPPLQEITAGVIETFRELDELDRGNDSLLSEGLGLLKHVATWGIRKIVSFVFRLAFRMIVRFASWVVREIIIKGVEGLIDWVVRPILMEVLGFIGVNPELWPFVALAGGVAALGFTAWKMFFDKSKDSTPSDVVGKAEQVKTTTSGNIAQQASVLVYSPVRPTAPTAAAPIAAGEVVGIKPLAVGSAVTASKYESKYDVNARKLLAKESKTVSNAIQNASDKTGVPVAILSAFAAKESGFNESISASTSSAKGLFQFLSSTWMSMLKTYGPRFGLTMEAQPTDPVAAALMGAAWIKYELYPKISKVVPSPTATDLYFGHFLGAQGGATFLQHLKTNPDDPAAVDMSTAAKANASVFYDKSMHMRSYREIYNLFSGSIESVSNAVNESTSTQSDTRLASSPPVSVPMNRNQDQQVASSQNTSGSAGGSTIVNTNKTYINVPNNGIVVVS